MYKRLAAENIHNIWHNIRVEMGLNWGAKYFRVHYKIDVVVRDGSIADTLFGLI